MNKNKGSNAQIGNEPFDDKKLIRCWSAEKTEWEETARENDESTSAWLRRLANEAVRKHQNTKCDVD